MALWCEGCPTVEVRRGTVPKPITLVLPFYQAHRFFAEQRRVWRHYDPVLWPYLRIIVVDDGSPTPLAKPDDVPVSLRLFRIDVDVPWNWLAARNIGAHRAEDGWLLLTDMDHVLPEQTLRALVYGEHDPAVVYAFQRREHTGEQIHPHSASFFMTKDLFWRIGGYDERLSGVYGTDGAYRKRLMAMAPVVVLSAELVRHEYVDDASVTTYERKTPAMRAAKAKRFAGLKPGPPKTLSFPYHEVTA